VLEKEEGGFKSLYGKKREIPGYPVNPVSR
jgi:hypothetical protein